MDWPFQAETVWIFKHFLWLPIHGNKNRPATAIFYPYISRLIDFSVIIQISAYSSLRKTMTFPCSAILRNPAFSYSLAGPV